MKNLSKILLCMLVAQIATIDYAEARRGGSNSRGGRGGSSRNSGGSRNSRRQTISSTKAVDTTEVAATPTVTEKTPQEKCAEASLNGWHWDAAYNACVVDFAIERGGATSSTKGAYFKYECPADATKCQIRSGAGAVTAELTPCEAMVYQGSYPGSTDPYAAVGKQLIAGCTVATARAAGDVGDGTEVSERSKSEERKEAAGTGAVIGALGSAGVSVAKDLIFSKEKNVGKVLANAGISAATGAAVGAATGGISGNNVAAGITGVAAGGLMSATGLSNKATNALGNLFGKKD